MDKLGIFFLGLGIGVAVGLRFHEIDMAIETSPACPNSIKSVRIARRSRRQLAVAPPGFAARVTG
jgi:hypothetical protein